MKVTRLELQGLVLLEPSVHSDRRGFFMEMYQAERYAEEAGLPPFVQDNLAGSAARVLRGLHYQWPAPQGKLVSALRGRILDVAVDVRRGSPTYREHVALELSDENRRQLYIPPGFAHGYVALSDGALCFYKCSHRYEPEHDRAVRWDDPELGIDWGVDEPILSEKDAAAPLLSELPDEALPSMAQLGTP